jgi:molecular chaperone DnaK
VTFDIDANGILNVNAKDKATQKSQNIRIEASSGLSEDEVKRMREEAQKNADSDRRMKEEVDKLNGADAMIFQTEKQLKEFGDKIPGDKKGGIEKALEQLKAAHKNRDLEGIDKAMANLNTVWQAASQEMYQNASQAGGEQPGAQPGPAPDEGPSKGSGNDEVTDVDFEEVKDK